jgi:hypothetical protein
LIGGVAYLCGCGWYRGARADVRFDDATTLETDAAFPAAFSALLQYLYEHRPSDISGLKAPVWKPEA